MEAETYEQLMHIQTKLLETIDILLKETTKFDKILNDELKKLGDKNK